MDHIVMTIRGEVFLPDDLRDYPWKYKTNVRPIAKTKSGFAVCEVILDNPKNKIDVIPQLAKLVFPRIANFDDCTEEIELYDGPRLAMKFKTLKLPEQPKRPEIREKIV